MRRRSLLFVATVFSTATLPGCSGDTDPPPYTSPLLIARLAALEAGGFHVDASHFGATVHRSVMPAQPHDPEQRPVLNGAPAHLRVAFDNLAFPATVNYRDRQVLVYPVAEYRAHFIGGARAGFDRRLGALRAVVVDSTAQIEGEIPVFPQVDADQRFRSRVRWIDFDGGRGIAFVTQYAKDASPPGPDDLAWVFQGLTDDGAWLVAIFHPIAASGVPASEDARRVAAALDAMPASVFDPDPRLLESMAASVRFSTVPAP